MRWLPLALLAALALLGAACATGAQETTPPETPPTTQPPASSQSPSPTQPPAGGATVRVEAKDFSFEPTVVTATAGQLFIVQLENNGRASHTFTIRELNVDVVLQPGQETAVTFTPQANVSFVCRFHELQGMGGSLRVGGGGASSGGGGTSQGTSGRDGYTY